MIVNWKLPYFASRGVHSSKLYQEHANFILPLTMRLLLRRKPL